MCALYSSSGTHWCATFFFFSLVLQGRRQKLQGISVAVAFSPHVIMIYGISYAAAITGNCISLVHSGEDPKGERTLHKT